MAAEGGVGSWVLYACRRYVAQLNLPRLEKRVVEDTGILNVETFLLIS